eukprot:s1766_g5.t1
MLCYGWLINIPNSPIARTQVASDWWGSENWWDDWWDDASWWGGCGWDDGSWWASMAPSMGGPPSVPLQPITQTPPADVAATTGTTAPTDAAAPVQSLVPVGDMKEEVQKFCEKFELNEDNQKAIIASLEKCGEVWVQDLRELDHALSKARNPATLLQSRLREIEALRGFKDKAKAGHLPGCMCPTCKELSFARALGPLGAAEGVSNEAKSLNAAALFAYQNEQDAMGGPSEEPESAFKEALVLEPKKGKGKGKPLVLPTGDLLPEVKAFCARFGLADRLQTKVMDTLRKRQDQEWRQDLAEMNRDLSKARNPSGLLVVKLGDIQKELNPNQLCFNYRAGTCTWGDKCRWSHDVAVGAERMKSSALLAAAAKGTIASLPVPLPEVNTSPLGFGVGAPPGSTEPSSTRGFGESSGASKVDKLLRRRQAGSPSPEAPQERRRRFESPPAIAEGRRRQDSPPPNPEGPQGDFRRRRQESPPPNLEGDFRRRRQDSPPPNPEGDFRRRRQDSPPPNPEGDFRRRRQDSPSNHEADFRRRRLDSPSYQEGDFRRRRQDSPPPEGDFRRRRQDSPPPPVPEGFRRSFRRPMESPLRRAALPHGAPRSRSRRRTDSRSPRGFGGFGSPGRRRRSWD